MWFFVFRIFRRISICPQVHIPLEVQEGLRVIFIYCIFTICFLLIFHSYVKDVDQWEFDIFHFNEISENKALKFIALDLFHRYSFLARFRVFDLKHCFYGFYKCFFLSDFRIDIWVFFATTWTRLFGEWQSVSQCNSCGWCLPNVSLSTKSNWSYGD